MWTQRRHGCGNQIEGLEKAIAAKEKQLADDVFRSRAPEKVVRGFGSDSRGTDHGIAEAALEVRGAQGGPRSFEGGGR